MLKSEAIREADLDRWIIRQFRRIRAQEVQNEKKRIERIKAKHAYVFENFYNRQDIEDAYGYEAITKRQFNEYLRIWDGVNDDNTKYEDRLRFIDRQIRNSQSTLQDMERIIRGEGDGF